MALDVYSPCLGGLNKKIKFCQCGKDLLPDLNKIVDAIEGGQRAGALGLINRQLELKGSRPCLLTLKGATQLDLKDVEGARKTAAEFVQAHPDSPTACALSAILAAVDSNRDAALKWLQRALAEESTSVHELVMRALRAVSQLLIATGDYLAARAHLWLMLTLAGDDVDRAADAPEILAQLDRSSRLSPLIKQDWPLVGPPDGALWTDAFQAAFQLGRRGAWTEALQRFEALADELPNEPTIWKNIAILAGNLARTDQAAEAWHRYAAMRGVDLEQAVQAEALAQMLAPPEHPLVPEVVQTYQVLDTDRVLERLVSDRSTDQIQEDLSVLGSDESPPPKAAFWLLDRPLPPSGENLTFDQVPSIVGELHLFGRETDRDARLDLVTLKTEDFESKADSVRRLLDEYGGELQQEQTIREVPAREAALDWQWRLPDDVTPATARALVEEKRRQMNLERWPSLPQPELDSKSPNEIFPDPEYRIRLLALILRLELNYEAAGIEFDFNKLRAQLRLPVREDLPAGQLLSGHIPLVQLHLLSPDQLSDDVLLGMFVVATVHGMRRAIRRLALALLDRTTVHDKVDRAQIYHALFSVARDPDEALQWLLDAKQAAIQANRSPALFLLEELELRRTRGEAAECQRLIDELQRRHIREPGVAQALYQWLEKIGAIAPDARALRRTDAATAAVAPPAAASSGIWTPDQGASPVPAGAPSQPSADKAPSGLWLPGMD